MTSSFDDLERRIDEAYVALVAEVREPRFFENESWSAAREEAVAAITDLVRRDSARERLPKFVFDRWCESTPWLRALPASVRNDLMGDIESAVTRAMAEELGILDGKCVRYPSTSILARRERFEGKTWRFSTALRLYLGNPFLPKKGGAINRGAYKDIKNDIKARVYDRNAGIVVEGLEDPDSDFIAKQGMPGPETSDKELDAKIVAHVDTALEGKPRQRQAVLAYLHDPFAAVESAQQANLRLGINHSVAAFLEDFLMDEEDAWRAALVAVVRADKRRIRTVSPDDLARGLNALRRLPAAETCRVFRRIPRPLIAAWVRNVTIVGGAAAGAMMTVAAGATMMV